MASGGGNRLWSCILVLVGVGSGLSKTGLLLWHGLRVGQAVIVIVVVDAFPVLVLGFKTFGVTAMLIQSIDSSLECLGVLIISQNKLESASVTKVLVEDQWKDNLDSTSLLLLHAASVVWMRFRSLACESSLSPPPLMTCPFSQGKTVCCQTTNLGWSWSSGKQDLM